MNNFVGKPFMGLARNIDSFSLLLVSVWESAKSVCKILVGSVLALGLLGRGLPTIS